MKLPVIIAGGGIGGLTLALCLHERGIPVRVFERVPELKPLGVGINLLPHAARVIHELGLAENLAVSADIPFMQNKSNDGDTERGLGDMEAGVELVAFQDIFGYPFIIPHAEVSFDTGDEDKGLGNGKTLFTAGISVGTVVMDVFHYVVDGRYTFNDKARDDSNEDKNVATIAGAFIWDLNGQFSLIAEGKGSNNKNDDGDIPIVFQGGIGYQATENLYINVLGGSEKNTDQKVIVSGKIAYTF